MFKQLCLLTRRPGMSKPDFEAYYESRHAPLATRLMPEAKRYQRRYVRSEVSPLTGEAIPIPFDCLTEIWWESRAAFERGMAAIGAGEGHRALHADEEKVFASHDNPVFSVEEYDTPMRGWSEGEALFKQVYLLKRRPGISPELFREHYENDHAIAGARRMPNSRRYLRRYVRPEWNPITGLPIEIPFDVILEVWWGSRAESEEAIRAIASNGQLQEIRDDREGIFASPNHPLFTVEERETAMG